MTDEQQLRAEYIALVAHELRSPMSAVVAAAQTLRRRWQELSPEQCTSLLALVVGETTRLARLIDDFLDVSRIDAGSFSYSFSEVDLGELVREAVATADLRQDEVRVTAKTDVSLPQVRGDADRLRQVLSNLIENAIKYSPAGGEVEVGVRAENNRVLVSVEDGGPGIPPDRQDSVFERFERAQAGDSTPGTGLGLFIARSIVEAHGGTLSVRSDPGKGATFTLALPAT